jgi:hypothetical protein
MRKFCCGDPASMATKRGDSHRMNAGPCGGDI